MLTHREYLQPQQMAEVWFYSNLMGKSPYILGQFPIPNGHACAARLFYKVGEHLVSKGFYLPQSATPNTASFYLHSSLYIITTLAIPMSHFPSLLHLHFYLPTLREWAALKVPPVGFSKWSSSCQMKEERDVNIARAVSGQHFLWAAWFTYSTLSWSVPKC